MEKTHVADMARIERESFSTPWSGDAIDGELSNPCAAYLVCEDEDGRAVGYIGVHIVLDEGHITNIAVDKEHRKRGIGAMLVGSLIEEAKDIDLSFLTLEVRQSNFAAIKLYRSFGFEECGKRPGYYQTPSEDALLLTKYF